VAHTPGRLSKLLHTDTDYPNRPSNNQHLQANDLAWLWRTYIARRHHSEAPARPDTRARVLCAGHGTARGVRLFLKFHKFLKL
jgi:hypothetical protein